MSRAKTASPLPDQMHVSTRDVAQRLGMAVRSVQMMVDRGELEAWKTPGGHRRIASASVERWLASRRSGAVAPATTTPRDGQRVLLIEDSKHAQRLVSLLVQQHFPDVELALADDGIAGLAKVGQWQPDVLIVDILLPGIDGAMLISTLRSHAQFEQLRLVVITSLEEADRAPYTLALQGIPVVHKSRLALDLVPHLRECLQAGAAMATA
jgi:excisionase family DNA binding protein